MFILATIFVCVHICGIFLQVVSVTSYFSYLFLDRVQSFVGMRTQDLQGEKDQLLVETADMLRVPLFTAEALLRHYGKFARLQNDDG